MVIAGGSGQVPDGAGVVGDAAGVAVDERGLGLKVFAGELPAVVLEGTPAETDWLALVTAGGDPLVSGPARLFPLQPPTTKIARTAPTQIRMRAPSLTHRLAGCLWGCELGCRRGCIARPPRGAPRRQRSGR